MQRTSRRERFARIGEVPFTSERKLMTTIQSDADQEATIAVVTKGAPDVLLGRCTQERVAGEIRPLTSARRARHSVHGRRTGRPGIAHIGRCLPATPQRRVAGSGRVDRAASWCTSALVGIIDPPRDEAA